MSSYDPHRITLYLKRRGKKVSVGRQDYSTQEGAQIAGKKAKKMGYFYKVTPLRL